MDYLNHFYGRNIKLIEKLNKGQVQSVKVENGGSYYISSYNILPGVNIYFNDIHVKKLYLEKRMVEDRVDRYELNHCREGGFQANLNDGTKVSIASGDFGINNIRNSPTRSFFPISHYHGVSIFITPSEMEYDRTQEYSIDYKHILEELCRENKAFILKSTPELVNIFADIYRVPEKIVIPYLRLKVQELFLYLSTIVDEMEFTSREYITRDREKVIKRIRAFVTKNSHNKYTYSQLTTIFPIKITTMKESYKALYKETIHETIQKTRLKKAADLLQFSTYNITEVAMEVGYSSHSKFTEAFKKQYGITPRQYRNITVLSEDKSLKGEED